MHGDNNVKIKSIIPLTVEKQNDNLMKNRIRFFSLDTFLHAVAQVSVLLSA
jgi:hypothetical protein